MVGGVSGECWGTRSASGKLGAQGCRCHDRRQAARFSTGDSRRVAQGEPAPWWGAGGASPVGGRGSQPCGGQHPVREVSGCQDISTRVETSSPEPRGPELTRDLGMALPLGVPWAVCSSPYFKSQNK